jgi:hypothetical protein
MKKNILLYLIGLITITTANGEQSKAIGIPVTKTILEQLARQERKAVIDAFKYGNFECHGIQDGNLIKVECSAKLTDVPKIKATAELANAMANLSIALLEQDPYRKLNTRLGAKIDPTLLARIAFSQESCCYHAYFDASFTIDLSDPRIKTMQAEIETERLKQ